MYFVFDCYEGIVTLKQTNDINIGCPHNNMRENEGRQKRWKEEAFGGLETRN
jgi:hypothetical protein